MSLDRIKERIEKSVGMTVYGNPDHGGFHELRNARELVLQLIVCVEAAKNALDESYPDTCEQVDREIIFDAARAKLEELTK